MSPSSFFFFFFNDTATTEIYTLSYTFPYTTLFRSPARRPSRPPGAPVGAVAPSRRSEEHTSELQSHSEISYAVFCLKKKNQPHKRLRPPHAHTPTTHPSTSRPQ